MQWKEEKIDPEESVLLAAGTKYMCCGEYEVREEGGRRYTGSGR